MLVSHSLIKPQEGWEDRFEILMFAELGSQRMRLTQYFSDLPTRQSEPSPQQAEDGFVALNKWCPRGFRGAACKKADGKVWD